MEQAIKKCHAVEYHRTIERKRLRLHLATLDGVAAAAVLLAVFGPAFLRIGPDGSDKASSVNLVPH